MISREESDFWKILDFLPAGICIVDSDLRVLFWNVCLAGWTGIAKEAIVGGRLTDSFPHLSHAHYSERIESIFHGAPPALFSAQLHPYFIPSTRPDGTSRIHTTMVIPFSMKPGEAIRGIIVLEDVTDLIEQISVIRGLRDQTLKTQLALSQANQKLNMLSNITRHDILNQVTGLLAYTEFLKETVPDDPKSRKYIDKILDLTQVIQQEITFTRDYQEMGVQNPQWQSVAGVLKKVRQQMNPPGISFQVEVGTLEIFADPLLEKVFYNLIDNSLRHSERVTAIRVTFQPGEKKGLIIFEDNGIGVEESIKEKLFRRGFGRNTGLGLFLIREILDITGLTITENGVPGAGARFQIEVPGECYRY